MEILNGHSPYISVVASYQYESDGRTLNTEDEPDRVKHLLRVVERTGARFGITGSISIDKNNFDLVMNLTEFPGTSHIKSVKKSGILDLLPMMVQEAITEIVTEIIVSIHPSKTDSIHPIPAPMPGELRALASAFSDELDIGPKQRVEMYQTLWMNNSNYTSLATRYLQSLMILGDEETTRTTLPYLLSIEPPTVTFDAYRSLVNIMTSPDGINHESMGNIKKLVRSNPNLIIAWLVLDNAYSSENVMYRDDDQGMTYVVSPAIDHHHGYASAIVLSMETIKRWPGYYRNWWGLSYNLLNYAGLVRGTEYWHDIPEETKKRYKKIMAIADDCLNQAMKRHPAQAPLYINKIIVDANRGRDWRPSFRTAAKLRPHDISIYKTAFNYSRPQWGGTKNDMREVYALATKNNPNASWPKQLRDAWAPEIKPIIDLSSTWLIIITVSCLLLFYWQWKKRDQA
jgi:hypothetical protein